MFTVPFSLSRKKRFSRAVSGAVLALFLAAPASADIPPDVRAAAEKVILRLERIEKESGDPRHPRKKEVFSENDLNAYIAYRIGTEDPSALKELRLKLVKNNGIEGKVYLDLGDQAMPGFRPQMNIYFSGEIESREGKVRIKFTELFLEQQRIQPALLDFVIGFLTKARGSEPFSIEDFFDLPYGIKTMETAPGFLTAAY